MAEPRSRNSRKRPAKAKIVAREPMPEPVADETREATVSTAVARVQGDVGGWIAMALAAGGLMFVGFLTVLLVIAASRA
jgi:hypothetical protein